MRSPPADDVDVSPQQLKEALRATLPAYMLPSRWLELPVLPKNANGKIDRTEIKRLFTSGAGAAVSNDIARRSWPRSFRRLSESSRPAWTST